MRVDSARLSDARAVTYRLGRALPGAVRLWTLQPLTVWETLRRERTLLVDPEHAGFDQDFRQAYDWMRGQMAERLPEYGGHYPWWAYDYRVDLRSWRYQVGPGPHVRLDLALPPERVLLSAYGAWHAVLGRTYLPQGTGEDEWDREGGGWDDELRQNGLNPSSPEPLPEPRKSRLEASWQRIFDVDDLRATNTIQACFERLELADVVEVTRFDAAVRRRSR